MRTRSIRSLIYFAGGLGLIVAIFTYLEAVEASLQSLCTVNAFVSCSAVANSGKTTLFGVPDSFIGIGGFVLILIIAGIAESRRKDLLWPYLLVLLTTAGVGLSVYFGYVELVEIKALCLVCFLSYVFGALAWVGSILLVLKLRAKARAATRDSPSKSDAPQGAKGTPEKS